MRTTIDIPDHLFRRAKSTAAIQGISLKNFLTKAIETELRRNDAPTSGSPQVILPLVPAKGKKKRNITGDDIEMALEQEDLHVSSGH